MAVLLLRDAPRLQLLCQSSCRFYMAHQGPEAPSCSLNSHFFFHGWAVQCPVPQALLRARGVREHRPYLQCQLPCVPLTSQDEGGQLWSQQVAVGTGGFSHPWQQFPQGLTFLPQSCAPKRSLKKTPDNHGVRATTLYPSQRGWRLLCEAEGWSRSWVEPGSRGAGTWERKCKPVRLSCVYFFCHTDMKRTVIYFGISVILGILEIFAVSQGIVGIRGVFSNKFLAMSKKGKLHASVSKPPPPLVSTCCLLKALWHLPLRARRVPRAGTEGPAGPEPPKPTFLLLAVHARCVHRQSLLPEHGWVIFSRFCGRTSRRV